MNKPNNYDNTSIGFTPVQLGGHIAVIKEVKKMQSKAGKDMLKVSIDFAQNDIQPRYFSELYKNDNRDQKKWPANATHYIMIEDQDGNTNRNFKAFITSYEESNGIACQWTHNDDIWCKQFNNRTIGVIYREEEDFYNDKITVKHKIARFCDQAKALTADVPDKKFYKGEYGTHTTSFEEDFVTVPDGLDAELPFN